MITFIKKKKNKNTFNHTIINFLNNSNYNNKNKKYYLQINKKNKIKIYYYKNIVLSMKKKLINNQVSIFYHKIFKNFDNIVLFKDLIRIIFILIKKKFLILMINN